MRVITGTAKGKPLKTLLRNGDTRPTTDKVKEAMFSAVQFEVEGAVILDLFAGSGQLGIEALSRGASIAYFADNNAKAIAVIRDNLEYTRLADRARVDRLPYNAFLRLLDNKADIAFIDPPYGKRLIEKVLPLLIPCMNPDGIIICEHEKDLRLPENIGGFTVTNAYEYGTINVTIFRSN